MESTANHLRLANHAGDASLLSVWLVGAKTTAQFTRRVSVRFYPQYDSDSRHMVLNALAGCIAAPGHRAVRGREQQLGRDAAPRAPDLAPVFAPGGQTASSAEA